MKIFINQLIPSEFSKYIYNHTPDEGLVKSININGVLVPIWISPDNTIISGHRRVNACKALGIEEIEAEIKEYSDLLVIEANRYREKTWQEKLREAEELEGILKPKAREKQKESGGTVPQKSDKPPIDTLKETAKALGTSHDTLHKVKTIAKEKPELLSAIDEGKRSVHSVYNQIQIEKQREERKLNKSISMIEGEYDVIIIDPPWPVEKINREVSPNQGAFDYPTMTVDEIKLLSLPAFDNCHLFLWTTQKYLPHALEIIRDWEFRYVCTFVWHKPGGFQPFGLPQYNCEFALYARKGNPEFISIKDFPTCFNAPRGKHSEKPGLFYEMIKRATDGKRLDMFSRRIINGFECWGNDGMGN